MIFFNWFFDVCKDVFKYVEDKAERAMKTAGKLINVAIEMVSGTPLIGIPVVIGGVILGMLYVNPVVLGTTAIVGFFCKAHTDSVKKLETVANANAHLAVGTLAGENVRQAQETHLDQQTEQVFQAGDDLSLDVIALLWVLRDNAVAQEGATAPEVPINPANVPGTLHYHHHTASDEEDPEPVLAPGMVHQTA